MVRGRPPDAHCGAVGTALCPGQSEGGIGPKSRSACDLQATFFRSYAQGRAVRGASGTLCEQALAGERGGAKDGNAGAADGGGSLGVECDSWLLMATAERLQY